MDYGNVISVVATFDFSVLPPEINSGRMYLGPGSGTLFTAAAAWDTLSVELSSAASGYASVISDLTGIIWHGPTSLAMTAAVMPYMAWLNDIAGSAAEIAGQARAAAAAYELAFAMTVPPSAIAANRTLFLALVTTNFLGQNTAAIAATEADYAQMWVQDAAAMHLYAESSALAAALPSFRAPAQTTNPIDSALSSPLVQILEHVPNVTNSVLSSANAVTSGRSIYAINMRLAAQDSAQPASSFPLGPRLVSGAAPPQPSIFAAVGRGVLVGKLSAPPSWAAAAPEMRPTATTPAGPTATASATDCGSVVSQAVLGTLPRDGPQPSRAKSKPIIVRSPAAG